MSEGSEGSGGLREHPVRSVDRLGEAVVVRLAGELDLYNADILRQSLFEAADGGPPRLVVDLGAVTFIDSTGLGVLIESRARLENRRAFVVASPGLEARRALEVSGLDRHLNVVPSVEEAVGADV